MEFIGRILVYRYAENDWNPEVTELHQESFEAPSIQAAKVALAKVANTMQLFSWIQSWDNEERTYTGKDLRWKPWDTPVQYKRPSTGNQTFYSAKSSERESGEHIYPKGYDKYGKSVGYRADVILYWE